MEQCRTEIKMRYVAAFPLVASLIASTWFPQSANAQHALDRLFLDANNRIPLYEVLRFNNETEAANFFGAASIEASLAHQFFAGYRGSSAHMLFARFPVGGARAHLYGANLSDLTLGQLQAINGSLSVGSQGYDYSASINLSGAASFPAAAARITAALNRRLPVGAVTTESSIAPVTASFIGSISAAVLNVAAVQSGSIEVGSMVTGPGIPPRQVVGQISGEPNGVGAYAIWYIEGRGFSLPTTNMTGTYGVLTVGSVSSGKVAAGQQVTDATGGILPETAIQANLSGDGAGSAWVVNKAQTVASENMTMTGAPFRVVYRPVSGATVNSGAFWIQQNGAFNFASSTMTYARGTAAGALGLTQASGAYLSSPGQVVTSPSEWMDNFIRHVSADWTSFQTTFDPDAGASPPTYKNSLSTWAQSKGGRFKYLDAYAETTPPIVSSLVPGEEQDLQQR
jgi:hypothetical protein